MRSREIPITQAEPAWYHEARDTFLEQSTGEIVGILSRGAARSDLLTTQEQEEEWTRSVEVMNARDLLSARVRTISGAVRQVEEIVDVILEFDFRRRGLRIDAVLIAKGAIFVVEFKRSKPTKADRDQVMNYAVNLLEFHKLTREFANRGTLVVPILVRTGAKERIKPEWPTLANAPWSTLASKPLNCSGAEGLRDAMQLALANRQADMACPRKEWLVSPFSPSSTMIDAALSLYGQHDVSAIEDHAAPKVAIDASTNEIARGIDRSLSAKEHRVLFLSGAPGAGKTLVGLNLAFRGTRARETVFVTGNAPLVEVLNAALQGSYKKQRHSTGVITGYARKDYEMVIRNADFKIVKAHQFLGKRREAEKHLQEDGRVVVFDEAQRTYESGRKVAGQPLKDHEANLILRAQRSQFPDGSVVVALIGQNQTINKGERDMVAWLEAAKKEEWKVSAGAETLALMNPSAAVERSRITPLQHGHLRQSIRFYRNKAVDEWARALLENRLDDAARTATEMAKQGILIRMTRDIESARRDARRCSVGARCGLVASSEGRRLGAVGLFVDFKPDIATWILAPSTDFRSSNALETVQKQYQVQGLELDCTVVCWDLDLRREKDEWESWRMHGADWIRDKGFEIAKNRYRVLLTRARKDLILFVPQGDETGEDDTRPCGAYDAIAASLLKAGARLMSESV